MNACSHSTPLVYAAAPRRVTLFAHPLNAVRPPLTRGRPQATPRGPFTAALMLVGLLWPAQPVLAELLAVHRGLVAGFAWDSIAVAVNQEYARANDVLRDGDEVALLPPVSGGCEDCNAD